MKMNQRILSILCGAVLGPASVAWAIPEEHRFLDREAVTETLTIEDEAALEAAQVELDAANVELAAREQTRDAAQAVLDAATADLTVKQQAVTDAQQALDAAIAASAPPEEIAALETAVTEATDAAAQAQQDVAAAQGTFDTAEAAVGAQAQVVAEKQQIVAGIGEEIERTGEIVDGLSNEQVFALGRNLNSAIKSGLLPLFISADDLQELADGNFGKQQINAFVRSFIQRARFEQHAVRFEAKGDLAKADRMRAKGQSQFEKFDAKIDRFGGEGLASEAQGEAKNAAKLAARDAAKTAAGGAAKAAAKDAAQDTAKTSAKSAAKDAAKQAATEAAKEESRGLAKGKGKQS